MSLLDKGKSIINDIISQNNNNYKGTWYISYTKYLYNYYFPGGFAPY